MLTYQDVVTVRPVALLTAAQGWDNMADGFKEIEAFYAFSVEDIVSHGQWLGESANAASARFAATRKQLADAQVEARAIASLLRDANDQFSQRISHVHDIVEQARRAGLSVNSQGQALYDHSKVSPYRTDYDETVKKGNAAAETWTQSIKDAVRAVDDADQGVRLALNEAAGVKSFFQQAAEEALGLGHTFNGDAVGDIEVYEAREAKDIATSIDSGKATAADYEELQRLFRDNSGDKAFSQTLLDELGARGTLKLSNDLESLGHYDDKTHAGRYKDLEHGLATTLATATRDPHSAFYKHFREEMKKAGTEQFKVDGLSSIPDEKVRGYQSLATLMQQGHGYSGQFLEDTANDIRHAEESYTAKGNLESIWALRDSFSGKDRGWFANDPLDGVLGIMSEDPKTSTEYLDPAHNDNLKYLLHGRDWDIVVDHYAAPPGGTTMGMPVMAEDGDARKGLGAALEAGATGHVPLKHGEDPWPEVQHNEAQTRIMQGAIENFKPSQGNDAPVPGNLRQPMADALAEYTTDTHHILTGIESETSADDKSAHLNVSQKDLVQVMRGLAEDPDAYGTLHKAEARFINNDLNRIPEGTAGANRHGQMDGYGAALGTYTAIREDVINGERMSAQSAADWKTKVAYHVIGGAVTPLYFTTGSLSIAYGDSIQRGVDTWMWDMDNAMKEQADNKAVAEIADSYLSATKETNSLVSGWADSRSDIDHGTERGRTVTGNITSEILDGQTRGSYTASKYL
ncbi:hypothetical protein ACIBCO_38410 [Streptomyces violascens]|uniref:hypothetical protein n=1 Tax=Streptomyces violascens TaxID=67381 RepID=UPI0037BB3904